MMKNKFKISTKKTCAITSEEIRNFQKIYKISGSLREVSRQTHRSINTIKKYLQGVVELKLQTRIKEANLSDDLLVGTYVGLWMGDGTQYFDKSYVVKFCSNKKLKELNKLIRDIIVKIFNKKSWLIEDKRTNRAYIKFKSKFIYEFIYDYCSFDKNKTLTVCLKKDIQMYSKDFIKGILLGLSLSDGHLKRRFRFNSISDKLANNVYQILLQMKLNPHKYVHNRSKLNWHDLHMISLGVIESKFLLKELNDTIQRLGLNKTFLELKENGPAEI